MPIVQVTFPNTEAIAARFFDGWVQEQLMVTMRRVGLQALAIARRYPTQNPRSTYRRTRTLGNNINMTETQHAGTGAAVKIATSVPYAKIVNDGHGPIVPVLAKTLKWQATKSGGGIKKGQWISKKSVPAWPGWHNFDHALEQGRAILGHELISFAMRVVARFDRP